jgi:hypothetical protein
MMRPCSRQGAAYAHRQGVVGDNLPQLDADGGRVVGVSACKLHLHHRRAFGCARLQQYPQQPPPPPRGHRLRNY